MAALTGTWRPGILKVLVSSARQAFDAEDVEVTVNMVVWPEPEPSGSQSPTLASMSPRFAMYDLPSLCRYAEDARLETPKYPTQTWMEVAADSSYCEYLKKSGHDRFTLFNAWHTAYVKA